MIRTITAKNICASWHSGQWSALYQFASSGIYTMENHLRYLQEVESCLHPEYNLYPGELNKGEERELNNLKSYFIRMGEINGLKTEFHAHTLYGYLIPYLTEDTNDDLANQVKVISYMK